jgi:hypothetical protein
LGAEEVRSGKGAAAGCFLILGMVAAVPISILSAWFFLGCATHLGFVRAAQSVFLVLGLSLIVIHGRILKNSTLSLVIRSLVFLAAAGAVVYVFGGRLLSVMETVQHGKQLRTAADIHSIGIAVESYRADHGFYPRATSIQELSDCLAPEYVRLLPLRDAWHQEFQYLAWGGKNSSHYLVMSFGLCGEPDVPDLNEYKNEVLAGLSEPTYEYQNDIVFGDGKFLRYRQSRSARERE